MNDIPITDKIPTRPVYLRYLLRKHSMPTSSPTDEEKRDAIKVLRECYPPVWEIDEILLKEAERIFMEADKQPRGERE